MADIHKPLTIAALCLMVVGIAFTLANAWFFFLADPAPPLATAAPQASPESASNVPIDEIAALHLFGRPLATPGGAADVATTENLRETRLSLALIGVFVATVAEQSRAMIARIDRDPESYAPGDRLPGNARLVEVYWDRVVISHDGEHQLIRFAYDTGGIERVEATPAEAEMAPADARRGAGTAAAEPAGPGRPVQDPQQVWHRYQEEFERDPERLLEDVGVELADGNDGYVVGALADLPEVGHAGLQPGDRILSVNGLTVGDPSADRLRIEDFLADGAARLEVQRGDRRFVVTVSVN